MQRITVSEWKHLPAGGKIDNGNCETMTVPGKPGEFYTLYQLADDHNCHAGWDWEKE